MKRLLYISLIAVGLVAEQTALADGRRAANVRAAVARLRPKVDALRSRFTHRQIEVFKKHQIESWRLGNWQLFLAFSVPREVREVVHVERGVRWASRANRYLNLAEHRAEIGRWGAMGLVRKAERAMGRMKAIEARLDSAP